MSQSTPTEAKKKQTRARSDEAREERRRALLDAALKCFNEQGYGETSIANITKTAGLSTGTFYLYFQSKVEVFSHLYNEAIDQLKPQFQEIAESDGGTYFKMLAVGEVYKQFYRDHQDYFRVLAVLHINQSEFHDSDLPINRYINTNATELLQFVAEILKQGIKRGEIKNIDPWLATNALWAMIDGLLIMEERRNFEFAGTSFEEVLNVGLAMFGTSLLDIPANSI